MMKRSFGLLRQFSKLHGSLQSIKTSFKVPVCEHWPAEAHGFGLGKLVRNIRTKGPQFYSQKYPDLFSELQAMGFVWNPLLEKDRRLLLALHTYKAIHGDLLVPERFVVPKDAPQWPEELHGMKLGSYVHHIRNRQTQKKLRPQLLQMGFDFSLQRKMPKFEDVLQGLLVFKEQHGHFLVPKRFRIEEDDTRYPAGLRGCSFGVSVHNINWNRSYLKHNRERLEAIGFQAKNHVEARFDIIFEALQCYQRLHGHLNIPSSFAVPHDSQDFPKAAWGMRLGSTSRKLMSSKCYKPFLPRLRELGIDVEESTRRTCSNTNTSTNTCFIKEEVHQSSNNGEAGQKELEMR